jgi:hypothetical protein
VHQRSLFDDPDLVADLGETRTRKYAALLATGKAVVLGVTKTQSQPFRLNGRGSGRETIIPKGARDCTRFLEAACRPLLPPAEGRLGLFRLRGERQTGGQVGQYP